MKVVCLKELLQNNCYIELAETKVSVIYRYNATIHFTPMYVNTRKNLKNIINCRVCSAACQMLEDSGALWQGARLHVSANIDSLQAGICSPDEDSPRVCARASVHCVTHSLMKSTFFKRPESVLLGYTFAIRMYFFTFYAMFFF